MTVCTQSRVQKNIIFDAFKKTGCELSPGINFKLHDFGYRGVSSVESAGLGGAGHLVNFWGTDTVAAMVVAHEYYAAPIDGGVIPAVCPGYSIPASEHSTITSWERAGETEAMKN